MEIERRMPDSTTCPSSKRPAPDEDNHDSNPFQPPSTPPRQTGSAASSVLSSPQTINTPIKSSNEAPRAASPSASSTTSVSGEARASGLPTDGDNHLAPPPQKKRKLTTAEKEAVRLEKEQKAKEREEKKLKKEEEQRLRDEEKRKKNEEREEKKREREIEKQQKEQARLAKEQAKEDERLKKERAQPKLLAFFAKPTALSNTVTKAPSSLVPHGNSTKEEGGESLSLEPGDSQQYNSCHSSPHKPQPPKSTDYEQYFLPFNVPSNTVVAPNNIFLPSGTRLVEIRDALDTLPTSGPLQEEVVQAQFRQEMVGREFATYSNVRRVKELIAHLHGSSNKPIDLTDDEPKDNTLSLFRSTPMKYIHFSQDVRPPYYGTFTRISSRREIRYLARNPTSKTLPEANYDYDSEAEWEEPEEGEDIDLDDEEEEEEDGDEDMEGFLDDEEDVGRAKRGLMATDMEPVSTGLCWEDSSGNVANEAQIGGPVDISDCQVGFLLEPSPRSIDPFSTVYWVTESSSNPAAVSGGDRNMSTIASMMNPPRLPLSARPNGTNNVVAPKTASNKNNNAATNNATPKPPKRLVPQDLMEEFKQEIDGSDLTKIALIEALKKKFPKQPKDAIANTLNAVAARVGSSNATKRWVLVQTT